MPREFLHRFERDGKRFAMDPESCFCFECDPISWDVLDLYPQTSVNRIYCLLESKHSRKELEEVVGELEWLRATKSILATPKREDILKIYDIERGVKQMSLSLSREEPKAEQARRQWFGRTSPAPLPASRDLARDAVALLLARSEAQKELHLEFVEDKRVENPDLIAELCAFALKSAKVAGKQLTVSVRVTGLDVARLPEALNGHTVDVRLAFQDAQEAAPHVRALAKASGETLARLSKILQPDAPGVVGQIIVRPDHPSYGGAVQALDEAGFGFIELDLDSAFAAHPDLDPQSMLEGLERSAVYYAQCLLRRHDFRLDPIASLFYRIYMGTPLRRSDPAGTQELAVDEQGGIYPSLRMKGIDAFRIGSLAEGVCDESRIRQFDDMGALTTQACMTCWARNLCGGGTAAVHHALSGSFRTPHAPWCGMQRAWMEAAVSAFQILSASGVNFERVYKQLGHRGKPSLLTIARAALTMTVGMRPIEEADAEMLVQWENWSESAYFLCHESGLLLGTKYDREMDALHPRPIETELILTRRNGEAFGLLRLRPELLPGTATAWIFMRDPADYASDTVRKGFRAILKEAGGQQAIRRLMTPVSSKEAGLRAFLESAGFTQAGVQREALYLHGAYHDVAVYTIATDVL